MILALDLGTATGFAFSGAKGSVISGTWDLRMKDKKLRTEGSRFILLKQQLDATHSALPITKVYYEDVKRHVGTQAAHVYGGLKAHVLSWCDERGIPYEGVGVGTIKKSFTGKGNAKKHEMIAECLRRGYEPADDNEADAIAILLLVYPEAAGETAAPEPIAQHAKAA